MVEVIWYAVVDLESNKSCRILVFHSAFSQISYVKINPEKLIITLFNTFFVWIVWIFMASILLCCSSLHPGWYPYSFLAWITINFTLFQQRFVTWSTWQSCILLITKYQGIKNCGSHNIFFEFHGPCSLIFLVVMCVS